MDKFSQCIIPQYKCLLIPKEDYNFILKILIESDKIIPIKSKEEGQFIAVLYQKGKIDLSHYEGK